MDENTEERLHRIESSLAHLEHQYDQLNQIVIQQEKLLGRLQSMVDRVDGTLREFELNQARDNNAKPPHYGDSAMG